MKPKAKTIQQRFGFKDNDLKKPSHYQIMKKLCNKDFLYEKISNFLINSKTNLHNEDLNYYYNICNLYNKECNFDWDGGCSGIGVSSSLDHIKNNRYGPHIIKEINLEVPIKNRNFMIGFIDIEVIIGPWGTTFFETKYNPEKIYIEIKTEIESVGETIRQINMYRTYLKDDYKFLLVVGEKIDKEIFESQNIEVVCLESEEYVDS